MEEAKKNNVLPLIDLDAAGVHAMEYHNVAPASGRYAYYPGTSEVPEATAARTLGASFKALAEIEFTKDTQGVIFAQGSRFGGYSLFVKDGKINFVYNFLGIPPEQKLSCDAPKSGKHIIGIDFNKKSISKQLEVLGQMALHVNDKVVEQADFRRQSGHYALCGEGLCIGYDGGDAVSSEYKNKFEFKGGEIIKVVFDVANDNYVDVARQIIVCVTAPRQDSRR